MTHRRVTSKIFNRDLLQRAVDLMFKDIQRTVSAECKVIDFKQPDYLNKKFNNFAINQKGYSDSEILNEIQMVQKYSVKAAHPNMYHILWGDYDQYSMIGDWLASSLNGTMYTYQMAPVFVLMENAFYSWIQEVLGWDEIDAVMTPGGSMANYMAIQCSRQYTFPEVKEKGMSVLQNARIVTSDTSHYSIEKAAILCGYGTDNVIRVKTNRLGQMIPEELDRTLTEMAAQGLKATMVNATASTTITGMFDNLVELSKVCKKHDVWLHCDAAFGGTALISKTHRHLMDGIELCDSMIWDQHKHLVVPMQCSLFATKHKGILRDANSCGAKYLFGQKRGYDISLDNGDMTMQCSRHIDIMKLWMYIRGRGTEGLSAQVDSMIQCAQWLADAVRARFPQFELLWDPQYCHLGFQYIPRQLQGRDILEIQDEMSAITPVIKTKMIERGNCMLEYQSAGPWQNFFRQVCTHPNNTKEDFEKLLDEIEICAELVGVNEGVFIEETTRDYVGGLTSTNAELDYA